MNYIWNDLLSYLLVKKNYASNKKKYASDKKNYASGKNKLVIKNIANEKKTMTVKKKNYASCAKNIPFKFTACSVAPRRQAQTNYSYGQADNIIFIRASLKKLRWRQRER